MRPEGRRYIRYGGFDISVEEYFFLVGPNWFLCTEAANDDTRVFLCYCGIPPSNSSAMSECLRNVYHLSQLLDCLVAVALVMLLDELRMTLAIIYRI